MNIPSLPDGLDLDDSNIGPFRELRYETADVFLHDLSLYGRIFAYDSPLCECRWLFRGVKDASYKLVPSAVHEKVAARLFSTPGDLWANFTSADLGPLPGKQPTLDQYEAERRVLRAFFYAADMY